MIVVLLSYIIILILVASLSIFDIAPLYCFPARSRARFAAAFLPTTVSVTAKDIREREHTS